MEAPFLFFFFLSDGKPTATEYSQYSARSGGNVFLDPWSGHVNTDCGRNRPARRWPASRHGTCTV